MTNKGRVKLAAKTIKAHGGDADQRANVTDLLADIMHWAQARKLDFHALLRTASNHYYCERADKELSGPPKVEEKAAFSIKVGDALDSLTDGRGLGEREEKIMALCDAAPSMYAALDLCTKNIQTAVRVAKDNPARATGLLANANDWPGFRLANAALKLAEKQAQKKSQKSRK